MRKYIIFSLRCHLILLFQVVAKQINGRGLMTALPMTLTCVLLPEIQAFFESKEGQREFAEWKAQRDVDETKTE